MRKSRLFSWCLLAAVGLPVLAQEPEIREAQRGGVPAPAIRAQSFRGRVWIPAEELEAHLGLRPGDPFQPAGAVEALRRLLSFRFIRRASPPEVIAVEGGRQVDLVWTVEERPVVRRVRLELRPVGRRSALDASELRRKLRTAAGAPLREDEIADDRETLQAACVEAGHLFAEVHPRVTALSPAAVEVVFEVEEGEAIRVRRIEVRGNHGLSRRQVLAVMETREPILGILGGGSHLPRLFEEDLERVRGLYRSHGYLDVVVEGGPLDLSPGLTRVDLLVRIEEGPRYHLRETAVRGNGPGVPAELLLRQVRSRPGPYDGRSLEEDRRRLLRWYQERYLRVPRIELRRECSQDPADLGVRAVFEIDEREHLFTGPITIRGNVRTRDRVARRALTFAPGDPLTELALEESASRLGRLGHFQPQGSRISAVPEGNPREVEVQVEERPTGFLGLTGGLEASTGEGEIATVSLIQTNFDLFALPGPGRPWKDAFQGGGQLFYLEAAPGTRQSQFLFRFEEPYLYNSYHSLGILGVSQLYDREGYDEARLRGEVGVRRTWDEARRFSTRLAYVVEEVVISDADRTIHPLVDEAHGHTFLAYPSLRADYRRLRVDPFSGPAGLVAEARGEAAHDSTGSHVSFLRAQMGVDLFQPVTGWLNSVLPGGPLREAPGFEHVLRLGARFGWAEGIDGDELPLFERFFLGGPRSVRGFDYRGIGPEAGEVRLGGQTFFQGTVEYSFPLFLRELRGVAIFDFADLEERPSDFSIHRLRTAVGGGLRIRWRPPFFEQVMPVDLYWVEALTSEPGDEERVFTFTVGIGF